MQRFTQLSRLMRTTLRYSFLVTVLFGCTHTEVGVIGELAPYTDLNAPLCDPFDGVERQSLNEVIALSSSESSNTTGVVVLEDGGGAIAARGWL
ncbi:MAG: hypothetical protein VX210_02155, partial [Myxococcota bacterium]|nr:hypothetical protein [Myxococcota bacterium]